MNIKLNKNEQIVIKKIEDAMKYCKGELELNLIDGVWIAMDYRKDLEGSFLIDEKEFNDEIISTIEAKSLDVDVIKCCDYCDISYVH